jgi:hypothetical protein
MQHAAIALPRRHLDLHEAARLAEVALEHLPANHARRRRGVVVQPTRRALRGYVVAFRWTVEKYSDWERLVGTDRWETYLDVHYQIEAGATR